MFQHVTVLVSFIFAIALTHVFSSASQLILGRARVRFSWLLTISMFNAMIGVLIEGGPLDMAAFFQRQRRVIFSATLSLALMGALATYLDRNHFENWQPTEWISAEVAILALGVFAMLAGWARPLWLQWTGVLGLLAQNAWWVFSYTLGS